jgi:acyl carrier protein
MGLDIVEFVMAVEAAFDVEIADAEAGASVRLAT